MPWALWDRLRRLLWKISGYDFASLWRGRVSPTFVSAILRALTAQRNDHPVPWWVAPDTAPDGGGLGEGFDPGIDAAPLVYYDSRPVRRTRSMGNT